MRFSCGETYESYKIRMGKWHRWFAWRPVSLDDISNGRVQCVWLEWIERKGYSHGAFDPVWGWHYRLPKKGETK